MKMKLKRFLFIGVAFVMMVALVLTGCEDLSQSKGKECTITFNADGGSFSEGETTQTQTVNSGASVDASMPANPERSGYSFGGWWTLQNGDGTRFTGSTTVTESITVYAYWTTAVPNTSLKAALEWLTANAKEGDEYNLTLT
ncbi:MAG: InlB B-repeat-containing protein, partial [Spirochaetaceae bacterium]|nr:InlB B-repeat-containing protein [Spirochaetaceae bacterium]